MRILLIIILLVSPELEWVRCDQMKISVNNSLYMNTFQEHNICTAFVQIKLHIQRKTN